METRIHDSRSRFPIAQTQVCLRRTQSRKRLGVSLGLGAVVASGIIIGIPQARAGGPTIHYPGGQNWAPIYASIPQTGAAQQVTHMNTTLRNGTAVIITCTGSGVSQTSWYMGQRTSVWDGVKIGTKLLGYTPDAWVDTGTMGVVTNNPCGGGGGGGGGGAAAAAAVSWANGLVGRTAYVGYCEQMMADAYRRGTWTSAIRQWTLFPGLQHTTTNPPAGALMFFQANYGNGNYGHVAIATGVGNQMISNSGGAIVKVDMGWEVNAYKDQYIDHPYTPYLGWLPGWDSRVWAS